MYSLSGMVVKTREKKIKAKNPRRDLFCVCLSSRMARLCHHKACKYAIKMQLTKGRAATSISQHDSDSRKSFKMEGIVDENPYKKAHWYL